MTDENKTFEKVFKKGNKTYKIKINTNVPEKAEEMLKQHEKLFESGELDSRIEKMMKEGRFKETTEEKDLGDGKKIIIKRKTYKSEPKVTVTPKVSSNKKSFWQAVKEAWR